MTLDAESLRRECWRNIADARAYLKACDEIITETERVFVTRLPPEVRFTYDDALSSRASAVTLWGRVPSEPIPQAAVDTRRMADLLKQAFTYLTVAERQLYPDRRKRSLPEVDYAEVERNMATIAPPRSQAMEVARGIEIDRQAQLRINGTWVLTSIGLWIMAFGILIADPALAGVGSVAAAIFLPPLIGGRVAQRVRRRIYG